MQEGSGFTPVELLSNILTVTLLFSASLLPRPGRVPACFSQPGRGPAAPDITAD